MSHLYALAAVAAAISLACCGAAAAERPAGAAPSQALAYVREPAMLDDMARLGAAEDRKLGIQVSCKGPGQARPVAAQVVSPIEFAPGKPDPVKGTWLTRYRYERCGEAKVYNALFVAKEGAAPEAKPFFPGSTNANAVLVNDAMRTALAAAKGAGVPPDCKRAYVYDMKVTAPAHEATEKGKAVKGEWNELWTFSMCGRLVDVPMTFAPDPAGRGTTYSGGKASLR